MTDEEWIERAALALFEACQPYVGAGETSVPTWSYHQKKIWEDIARALLPLLHEARREGALAMREAAAKAVTSGYAIGAFEEILAEDIRAIDPDTLP